MIAILYSDYRHVQTVVCELRNSSAPVITVLGLFRLGATSMTPPQWGAADAEIKVPSDENTELKGSPFQGWSRSVYCHAYYAYCQGFLPR